MNGTEIGKLVASGFMSGMLQAAKILAPYILGFCAICVIISLTKRAIRNKRK